MNELTLADVLGRAVDVQWYEAVAVARGVTAALQQKGDATPRVPELIDVRLWPNGNVTVTGGTTSQEPIRRLGQLLQALLGQSEPPVPLRLFVSQAIAPIPTYASLREFDDSLGYFERPGRNIILQSLFERAADAPAKAAGAFASLDSIAPLPAGAPAPEVKERRAAAKKQRPSAALAAAAALVLVCAAAAFFRMQRASVMPATGTLSEFGVRSADGFGRLIVSGMSFVTEHLGLGRVVSADVAGGDHVEPAAAPKSATTTTSRNAAETADSHHPAAAAAKPAAPDAAAPAHSDGSAGRAARSLPSPAPPSETASVTSSAPFRAFDLESATPSIPADDPNRETIVVRFGAIRNREELESMPIFSAETDGISAPVALRPQLPRELPPTVKRTDLRLIELVISPVGSVESVKLVGAPRNVHDSMLLSAVKAWEFVPALKDGVPVRYRKTITIAPRN